MRRIAPTLALVLVASAAPAAFAPAATAEDPSVVGVFGQPFEQPGPKCTTDAQDRTVCKPAAVSQVALADGTVLYWDGLEGMEDVRVNTVAEIGNVAQDDLSRILDLRSGRPVWSTPKPADAGTPNATVGDEYLPVVPHNNDRTDNDGDLFCSDQVQLADGTILNVGGTGYYLEPGVSGVPYGLSELEGLKATRLFDPVTDTWRNARGRMRYGRWYPSLVTLPNGDVLVASGVTKLIKPVYPDRPEDSGTNVKQLETYHPASETWSVTRASAHRSLPLFPRLHLLPNGKVYYDAAGQTFNPDGQSYDEALWNMAAVYDPASQTWSDLGLPKFGPALQGFRGSAFSQQLTLKPPYTRAQFLSAGGVYGVTPGTYLGTSTSTLNTVDVANGLTEWSSEATGEMANGRWYSTGVTLPTGEVLAFSGADRDEVVGPGSGAPVTQAELFDPATKKWRPLASARKGRTYHNSAILLQDGRVLVGGHAPINTGYAVPFNEGREVAGLSDAFRDPSFEVFTPPNLFYGQRPVITDYDLSQRYGRTTTIQLHDARDVASVVIVRNPSLTHLINADQKVVELPIVRRDGNTVTVATPPSANVAVPGPYWLFVNKRTAKGLTPSVGRQVFVGAPVPERLAPIIERNNAEMVRRELPIPDPPLPPRAPKKKPPRPRPHGEAAAVPATLPNAGRSVAARPVSSARGTARTPYALLALAAAAGVLAARRRLAPRR
ncbi:MAG TPA: galactose oxidase-like domain-containing protein [Mycobacteriales bacterium]|jgi:hypothetical protein